MSRLEQSGQRLGPCAVLCFSQEHRPCERTSAGSAGLTTGPSGAGQQDRRAPEEDRSLESGALEPPDTTRSPPAQFCRALQWGTCQDLPAAELQMWSISVPV